MTNKCVATETKECACRNSRGAVDSGGTVREVPAPWVAPRSKAAWGGDHHSGRVVAFWPVREERRGPKPSPLQCLAGGFALSARLPNSREDAYLGCSIELTQPVQSEELKKQSERLGEGAGATGAGSSTQIALSLGAACEPRGPARQGHARGGAPFRSSGPGHPQSRTVSLPLKKPKRRKAPAPGLARPRAPPSERGLETARHAGGSDLSFGGKMAGPGKQRKLGPGPESGLCGSRARPGYCVGVAGRLCQPARHRLGETQSTLPGAGGAPPPTCRGPASRGSRGGG